MKSALMMMWLFLPVFCLAQGNVSYLEILQFKIEADYSRILDRKSSDYTADNPDSPRTMNDMLTTSTIRRRGVRQDEARSRGRLRSQLRVIGDASWVYLTVRNNGLEKISSVTWDFAFPRYENGQLVKRFEVTSQVEIKPGAKKTLKYQLPPGAKRCQTLVIDASDEKAAKTKTYEAVCGPGFHDPSGLHEESVMVKKVN